MERPHGFTSVTPLKANFMEAPGTVLGELKLPDTRTITIPHRTAGRNEMQVYINYEDDYVQPLILQALNHFQKDSFALLSSPLEQLTGLSAKYLQISSYETMPFEALLHEARTVVCNSYIIRKALIRKHYLANTITSFLSKNPNDILSKHVPISVQLELDYAEFLDEALLEVYELHEAFAKNETLDPVDREWWILKPSMSDRGQGIRLFSTEDELRSIFEEWEVDQPDSEDEEDEEDDESNTGQQDESSVEKGAAHSTVSNPHAMEQDSSFKDSDAIPTSQLRHFICQSYIPPLLLPSQQNRKSHLRSYVLAVGAIKVYVYDEMLALFAPVPYIRPGASTTSGSKDEKSTEEEEGETEGASRSHHPVAIDMAPHLTNTCLQPEQQQNISVSLLSQLSLPASVSRTTLLDQIYESTASLFRAAIAQPTSFQPLPNAFEIYGLDWLVDEQGTPWLLEVNAFPDFKQSGDAGHSVVEGVWSGAIELVGKELLGVITSEEKGDRTTGKAREGDVSVANQSAWVQVLDVDLGRG